MHSEYISRQCFDSIYSCEKLILAILRAKQHVLGKKLYSYEKLILAIFRAKEYMFNILVNNSWLYL